MEAGRKEKPIDVYRCFPAEASGAGPASESTGQHSNQWSEGVGILFSSAATFVLSLALSLANEGEDPASCAPKREVKDDERLLIDWRKVDHLIARLPRPSSKHGLKMVDLGLDLVYEVETNPQPGWLEAVALCTLLTLPWAEHEELLLAICSQIEIWEDTKQLMRALSQIGSTRMAELVSAKLQQFIVLRLLTLQTLDRAIESTVAALGMAWQANEASNLVDRHLFHCDAINADEFDIRADYMRWLQGLFSFCSYSFMYEAAAKAEILRLQNRVEMREEFQQALLMSFMSDSREAQPYFVLKVRREHLLNDTVLQMRHARTRMKRPLKVVFVGEAGVDEGGVAKEFFQLLTDQLLNPDFGMLQEEVETRQLWFRASHIQSLEEFELIGSLVGLAIYNGILLDVSFPLVLYRKLLGNVPTFEDLRDFKPSIYSNLERLRQLDSGFEDLGLVFQAEQENEFGDGFHPVDLRPGGGDVPVTQDNVLEYIEEYARHLMVTSISSQFEAFKEGFSKVCGGAALELFFAEDLQLVLQGIICYDWGALRQHTRLEGFSPSDDVVLWFWETVGEYDEEQQRRLLSFVTGSDRVPIKGLGALTPPFALVKNGDEDRLPTAHTCFNVFMLPAFKDKATLQRRMQQALENSQGFGLQ
eukprot:CAMPEP_0206151274 /NCGR_PEP_ID=MMETSP1473-20131121/38734_1 /ASSEMBLY_ACC=CAM_ASM_001109 /TAXON_ID=1461547 /ORGANISM="Stichococcus sp, Strain RCC1054" /LENGTH=645 /DNA_ID=CAMNT_0053548813 /DNA_START=284 /DNA_END=2221 /DNA_ORIENTATION=+